MGGTFFRPRMWFTIYEYDGIFTANFSKKVLETA